MNEQEILKALSHVEDPDFKKDVVSLGMIKDLKIEGNDVSFRFVLTTPACPMKDMFVKACTVAIQQMVNPQAKVHIQFDAKPHTPTPQSIPNVGSTIVVYSAKGGVGKSTIAANLAVALSASGAKVGLVDADIYGPSLPVLFGLDESPLGFTQEDGKNKMIPIYKHGVHLNSLGFLTQKSQAIAWRGPMASTAIKQLLFDTKWPELDYLIVDMPPGTGDIHLTVMQAIQPTGAIVVTTPHEVAVEDTRRSIAMLLLDAINVPILGLVENMSYMLDGEQNKHYIFGKEGGKHLAGEFGLILLGEIPFLPKDKQIQPLFTTDENQTVVNQIFQQFVDKTVRVASMRKANIATTNIAQHLNS